MSASKQSCKVMISHESIHKEAASTLAASLCCAIGLSDDEVFIAPRSISRDPAYQTNNARAIVLNALDASVFIILGTPTYMNSFWCRFETLLRETKLQTKTGEHRNELQCYVIWIDHDRTTPPEDKMERYFPGTSLTNTNSYNAWDPDGILNFLTCISQLLQVKSEPTAAHNLAQSLNDYIDTQVTPEDNYREAMGTLRGDVEWEHHVDESIGERLRIDQAVEWESYVTGYGTDDLNGLRLDQVTIKLLAKPYCLVDELADDYANFFCTKAKENRAKYWSLEGEDDGHKLMLALVPQKYSDQSEWKLPLVMQDVRYSQTNFFEERARQHPQFLVEQLNKLCRQREIDFAGNSALHVALVTSDERVVLAKRRSGLGYHPDEWAATLEEQGKPREDHSLEAWVSRALKEEAHLERGIHFDVADARLLNVVLELADLGLSLCVLVRLKLAEADLRKHFRTHSPKDREFGNAQYLTPSQALGELFNPTLSPHHPTSRFRLYYALLCLRDVNWVKSELGVLCRS